MKSFCWTSPRILDHYLSISYDQKDNEFCIAFRTKMVVLRKESGPYGTQWSVFIPK